MWTVADIPPLNRRTVLVTGANSGIGLQVAQACASRGARVLLACRSVERGRAAMAELLRLNPNADLELLQCDLADLDSVRTMGRTLCEHHASIDVVFNNAGIMALPRRQETRQGLEMQLGVNHLGHFLLITCLLPKIKGRIVTTTSMAHWMGRIHFDDLQLQRAYGAYKAYAQSKLANALFTVELQRRLQAMGSPVLSVAAHPGLAHTNLQLTGPRAAGGSPMATLTEWVFRRMGQSDAMGALPCLYAAFAKVDPGACYGPDRIMGLRGHPTRSSLAPAATNPHTGRRLWHESEKLTDSSLPQVSQHVGATHHRK